MGKDIKITCDNCEKDLSSTAGMPDFRLKLSSESLPNTSDITFAVYVSPDIDEDLYFCGLGCLKEWIMGQ